MPTPLDQIIEDLPKTWSDGGPNEYPLAPAEIQKQIDFANNLRGGMAEWFSVPAGWLNHIPPESSALGGILEEIEADALQWLGSYEMEVFGDHINRAVDALRQHLTAEPQEKGEAA